MRHITALGSFLVLSNLLLSIGLALIAYSLMYFIVGKSNPSIFIFVLLMSFSMYSLNRLTDEDEDKINNPQRAPFISKYRMPIQISLISAYLIAALLVFFDSINGFFVVLLILLLGVLYSVPFVPTKLAKTLNFRRLKDIFIVKNFIIAIVWTLAIIILPAVYLNINPFSASLAVLAFFLIIRSFINTTFFDLRDIRGDKIHGVKTLPVTVGLGKTLHVLILLNIIISVLLFFSSWLRILPITINVLQISTVYSLVYIYLFGKVESNLLCDYIVDGEFILIGLLALVVNII